jgi:hypothetical protein
VAQDCGTSHSPSFADWHGSAAHHNVARPRSRARDCESAAPGPSRHVAPAQFTAQLHCHEPSAIAFTSPARQSQTSAADASGGYNGLRSHPAHVALQCLHEISLHSRSIRAAQKNVEESGRRAVCLCVMGGDGWEKGSKVRATVVAIVHTVGRSDSARCTNTYCWGRAARSSGLGSASERPGVLGACSSASNIVALGSARM